ncbi:MAG TPA: glycosyl hydrolase family 18 protein, partial [Terriglobales bacterium]|nr:glycosyl hydrolase family 18 protein [Terriglobales bacterium]
MAKPVFYDPRQARWKRLRRLFDVAAITISLVVAFFVYNALHSEHLPELLLQTQKRPYHSLSEKEKEKAREKRRLAALHRGARRLKKSPSQVPLNAEEGVRAAFYVPWDAASFSSLREYAHQIDVLYPEWLHVLTPDGHLQGEDPETIKYFDVVQGKMVHSVDNKVMSFLKAEGTSMEVFPLVNNFDGTSWIDISGFLDNPGARSLFRQQVAAFLAGNQYGGLMVDFEDFPKAAQPGYVTLLDELSQDLHARGLKLYVSVPAANQDFNYAATAAAADGVVLMNYDEHYPSPGLTGPVASQDWFTRNLAAAKKVIPQNKLICAIANYGYDWVQKPRKATLPPDVHDINVSVQEAWLGARDSEADIDFDSDALNPHFSYLDEHNLHHDV